MAKDAPQDMRLDDLSDREIERIEALVFCLGGPPDELSPALLWRASGRAAATRIARAA